MKTYLLRVLALGLILAAGLAVGCSNNSPASGTPPASTTAASSVRIQIISPRDNAIVAAGSNTVRVSMENVGLDQGHAWRLYLDGVLMNTVESGIMTSTLPISVSGPHEIKATLTDAKNAELASAAIEVTAAPETPNSSPFNLPWVAPAMGVFVVGILAIIALGLRMTRGRNP